MTDPQAQMNEAVRVNIDRLQIRMRGVSPSQARALAEGLGEQVLRQLALLMPAGNDALPARWQNQPGVNRQAEVGEIHLQAPASGIAQAVAHAAVEGTHSEG